MELMKSVWKRKEGFTLVEVMIALVLFAIGMLAFGGLEIIALRNVTFSKDYGKANTYAQRKVEEMKGTAWASVSAGSDTLEEKFTRNWTVTTQGEIKNVSVTVSWLDPKLGTKQVSFYTDLYSNPGVGN
jgi:prepilin-type N-terminal cleavage/methylation domain-containing protein